MWILVILLFLIISINFIGVYYLPLRIIRVVLGLISGGMLGVGGAVLQVVLHNPLAEPYILGVVGGASIGYTVAMLTNLGYPFPIILSIVFSIISVFIIYKLSYKNGFLDKSKIILNGISLNLFSYNFVVLIFSLKEKGLLYLFRFLWGWLGIIFTKDEMSFFFIWIIINLIIFIFFLIKSNEFDIYEAGEMQARITGIEVEKLKKMSLILVSISTGLIVSICGIVSFVGLVVPHIVKLLKIKEYKNIFLGSFLGGGILVLLADWVSRKLKIFEVPLSALTGLIGVIFLVWFLNKKEHYA